MIGNYLIVALRNLARNRLTSFINIAGLALGLTCVILIALFIRDETSFDKWVPGSSNLYRLDEDVFLPARAPILLATSDFPLPALLKDNLPEVTGMTRFWPRPKTITIGNRAFTQDIAEVDSNFFQLIRFPLVAGDPATVLSRPDAIVLSQALARKYFGNADPVGQTLAVNKQNCPTAETISCANDAVILHVTGVMADLPHNTHMRAEAVMPHTSPADAIGDANKKAWFSINGYGYVRLARGADPAGGGAQASSVARPSCRCAGRPGHAAQGQQGGPVRLWCRFRRRAYAGCSGPRWPTWCRPAIPSCCMGWELVGALILLVACFNFTNLATARALLRAREIALRKCAGARRSQIIFQFLGEAVLTALLALALALSLTEVLRPLYDRFLDRPIALHYGADWRLVALIVAIAAAAGLASGFYPALVLSRFRPAPVLRANDPGHTGSSLLRAGLVVLQFTVAIGLAIVTIVVFTQLDFMRRQSLGFRRDNVVVVSTFHSMTAAARDSFVAELRRHPGIVDVAQSGADVPFSGNETIAQMRASPGHPEYLTMKRQVVTAGILPSL